MAQAALTPVSPLVSPLSLNPAALGLPPGLEPWTAAPLKPPQRHAALPLTPPPHPLQEAIARTDARFVSFGWGPQQSLPFECLRLERRAFHALFATQDQKEGMQAFIDKRPPQFSRPR